MKVYLSGGMKTKWQDSIIQQFPNVVFLDPRSRGLLREDQYTFCNVLAIKQADIILAHIDKYEQSGIGLALEVGFAHAIGKLIIFVDQSPPELREKYGMVRQLANVVFYDLDQSLHYLKCLFTDELTSV